MERGVGEYGKVLNIVNALVHVFIEEGGEDFLCDVGVLIEEASFFHMIDALGFGQRRLVIGDVTDEVKVVNVLLSREFAQGLKENAALKQGVDNRLFLFGVVP